MDKVRGLLLLAAGVFVLFRGIVMHGRPNAWTAVGLGVVAIALGLWRLLRKPPQTRI